MFQKISLTGFVSGLVTFCGIATEVITEHTVWTDFTRPIGVVHLLVLGAAFAVMIAGALGVQLPRDPSANYGERKDDKPTV